MISLDRVQLFTATSVTLYLLYKYTRSVVNSYHNLKIDRIYNEVLFFSSDSMLCQDNHKTACTTPRCYEYNLQRILAVIGAAKRNIYLCMYILTCPRLAKAIHDAKSRGVVVRVITDYEQLNRESMMQSMKFKGIDVRAKEVGNMIMHYKLCLVDTDMSIQEKRNRFIKKVESSFVIPSGGVVMLGSLNWTVQSMTRNYDSMLITSNPLTILKLAEEFSRMWIEFAPQEAY